MMECYNLMLFVYVYDDDDDAVDIDCFDNDDYFIII